MSAKRDEILDVSEAMIRRTGFNGFSTRDVADAVEPNRGINDAPAFARSWHRSLLQFSSVFAT